MRTFSPWLLAAEAIPAASLLWGLLAIVGLILWLLGRRLAKPACAIAGLVIGLAAGWLVAELAQAEQSWPVYLIAGSLIGAAVCWWLFRLWMGIGLALVLSLTLTPILLTDFPPHPPPPSPLSPLSPPASPTRPSHLVLSDSLPKADLAKLKKIVRAASSDSPANHRSSDWSDRLMPMIRRQAAIWHHRLETPMPTSWKHPAAITAGVALLGLSIGLLMPRFAASVQSTWAGGWMVLTATRELIAVHAQPIDLSWLHSSDHWLVALGLITILGVIVQCSIGRPKTDQKDKATAGS